MENVYCKDIEVDFVLDTTPIDNIKKTDYNPNENGQFSIVDLDSNLVRFLDNLGIEITHSEIFYTPPRLGINIHVDGTTVDVNAICKLNWVFGAKGSFMTWWELKDPDTQLNQHRTPIGTPYLLFDQNDCEAVWRQEIHQPTLVNAGLPHNMHNPTEEARWCVSYALGDKDTKQLLRWDDAVIRFSNYIKE
jgi:hypothetical protein